MARTHTVIVGAGHAGLAMSRCLSDRGVPHVVLDRGCVGERWRTARWDSFRLLTPNWLSRLPGWRYTGPEPDGFMSAGEFAAYLSDYARSFEAPVRPYTPVRRVVRADGGFAVHTAGGDWTARCVVVATGYHTRANVPELAAGLPPDLAQHTSARYRSPESLPDGGVLVVGSSASGVQLAYELVRAGRQVVLAVGGHTRLPRQYRGRDILWWLDRLGSLDRTIDEVRTSVEPSPQLAGLADGGRVDLGVLRDAGVRLVGRLRGFAGPTAEFAGDLRETVGAAQRRLDRVLARIDAAAQPGDPPPDPPPPIAVSTGPARIHLRRAGISTVLWATGYRPWYPWLALPVLDPCGRLRHRRGVTDVPGLYAIGQRFQHRRSATLVDGARHDAAFLADRLVGARHGNL
jgi:putative flavoprotein involved in K+ transport